MENWKLLLAGIRNIFKDPIKTEGVVEVSNLPEVQRVEITNPQEPTENVVVSNLVDYKEELNKIIGELIKVPKDIKTADYSPIIKALQEVVRTLEADKADYSPIILSISSAVKELKDAYPTFNIEPIVNLISGLQQFNLNDYLKYGELPVVINEKQIEKLVKAFGKSVGTVLQGGSGSTSLGDISVSTGPIENGSGVISPANPLDVTGTLTATVDTSTLATETTLDAIRDNIGEAVASPTAYTVLNRLNNIEGDINTMTGDGVFIRDVDGNKIYPATTNDIYQLELLETAIYTSVGATLGSDTTAIKTSVQLLDNAVDGNYLNINNNIAGTDVAAGAGAVNAQTQRVTLGSNDPAVTALQTIDSSVKTYALQYAVDSGDSTITYVGKAVAGSTLASASWQIKQITDTSGDLSILFADGDILFNNVWNNRESLSYS